MEKNKMIDSIREGFLAYEMFVNKELHYIYKKNNVYKEIVLKAKRKEFMHLCGVAYLDPKTKKKVTANHFYNLVKANKISPSFLIEKNDGTTELKLQVIGNLKDILTPNIRVIDGQVTFYNLSFDTGLRTRRQIFALSLIKENHVFVPLSLLNLKTDKADSLRTSYEVHSIHVKNRDLIEHVHYQSEEYMKYLETLEAKKLEKKEATITIQ